MVSGATGVEFDYKQNKTTKTSSYKITVTSETTID